MYLGSYNTGATVYLAFTTHAKTGAAVAPLSAYEAGDVKLYKNGSATERSSTSGFTMTSPFDSITGLHLLAIDLSDNTDAGFWSAGAEYMVVLSADTETVDGLSVVRVLGYFSIERVVKVNVAQWLSSVPNALQSGRVDSYTGAMAAAVLTATAIASDAITAAKIANDAITAAKLADDAITAAKIATDAIGAAELATGAVNKIRDAILADSTPFNGASIATIVGYVDELESRLTAIRAGYLDNLNVGGNVASSAEATAIQNNTRVVRVVPDVLERPDIGTVTYRIELLLYDAVGNMEAPDSAPTIALVNQAGTDRSARLDSTTMALVSTGRYRAIYTADVGDALEQLVWTFSVVEGGATRLYGNQSVIVDTTAVDFTAADRAKLDAVHGKLPSKSYLTGTTNSDGDVQLNEATGALPTDSVDAGALAASAVTEIQSGLATSANQTTILARLGAFTGTGVNTVLGFFKGLLSKTASTPSDVGGTFDPATDSTEAIRDRGDAAWTTATGFATPGDVPTTAQMADKFLGRNLAGGADGGRTVQDALRFSRNKVVISGSTITIYQEDDVTPAWVGTIATASRDALASLDPS